LERHPNNGVVDVARKVPVCLNDLGFVTPASTRRKTQPIFDETNSYQEGIAMITLKNISSSAFVIASVALIASSSAHAQIKQGTTKTVFENDKIAVQDNVLKPGEESPSQDREGQILYYISGGTVERTFGDGSKETVTRKTGQALPNPEKRPYAVTNTGKTTMHVVAIKLK
jgi:hypothetical protein